ncbi:hypothetical protein GF352_02155 [archaeon]|nr:hypothetical protein [archaeon]
MLLAKDSIKASAERTGLELDDDFDPLKVVNIDPVAIAPRHLIRAPYSLNEKKWRVSLPINPKRVLEFDKDEALPEKVVFKQGFLDKSCDATELFIQAFDWYEREEKKKKVKQEFKRSLPKKAVAYNFFPPCVQNILKGLPDGRKRALFVLINFYHQCGYDWALIEERLSEWNSKNEQPLRSSYIKSQLEWARRQGGLMPPNCSNPNYKDIRVCDPDNYCTKIKNPVTYALRKNKTMKPKRHRQRKRKS